MKRKKTQKQKLKEKADQIFSEYIRLKYSDWRGYCECYTCGKTAHYKDGMQNGHFISRSSSTLRYSEDNCRTQCYACNCIKNGNYIVYTLKMIEEVGIEKVEELRELGKELHQFTEKELQEIVDKYMQKIKDL